MARKSGSEKRRLGSVLTIRVSAEMDAAIVNAAAAVTRGDWVRGVIAEKLQLQNEPTKRASAGIKNTLLSKKEDVEALRGAAATVARAAGMLKLTAQQMRISNEQMLYRNLQSTLAEMKLAAREIQARLEIVADDK